MLGRATFLTLLVAGLVLAYWAWRRPPRRLVRLDLRDVGLDGPAIVQFTSPTCAPCRKAAPVLAEAAERVGLRFAQIDVADRPDLAGRYGIRTVPTIVVASRGGTVVASWTSLPEPHALDDVARVALG